MFDSDVRMSIFSIYCLKIIRIFESIDYELNIKKKISIVMYLVKEGRNEGSKESDAPRGTDAHVCLLYSEYLVTTTL